MGISFLVNVALPSLVDSAALSPSISSASLPNEFKIYFFVLLIVLFVFYDLDLLYLSMDSMLHFCKKIWHTWISLMFPDYAKKYSFVCWVVFVLSIAHKDHTSVPLNDMISPTTRGKTLHFYNKYSFKF